MKHIVRIFSKPAPNLTHLKLIAPQRFRGNPPFPNLIGLEFPKLRVLKVAGVEGWPEVVGTNLTHITINDSLNPWVLKDCILYSRNLKALKIQGLCPFNKPILSASQKIILPPGVRLSIQRTQMCSHILALFALPQDSFIKLNPSIIPAPNVSLLSYVLPTDISHLQNLHTIKRLHMKVYLGFYATLELKCFRLDQPAFEADVSYSFESQTTFQHKTPPVMHFLRDLHQIVLRGVEELRMEGFVRRLEPQEVELLAFLKRMPVLTRLVTTDGNEGHSALHWTA